jgi:hypothetical protein
MRKTDVAVLLAAVLAGMQGIGAVSETVAVNTSPARNMRWSAVTTNEVALTWEWPAAAARARLEIAGMNGTATVDFTEATTRWVWQVSAPGVPPAEDVVDLTLTFKDGAETVVGVLTSRLAVVTGAPGETAVIPTPENQPWPKLKGNAVISYDAGWSGETADAQAAQMTIAKAGGMTQTNALPDAAGFFGWKVKGSAWGYGAFGLSLTFPGAEGGWDAALTRLPDGTVFGMR